MENQENSEKQKIEVMQYLSKDLRYEKFLSKIKKRIPNLKKTILLFLLVNNQIDENGVWLEFGESKYNNTNHISHYTKNTLFHFKNTNSQKMFNKNVKIIEGDFLSEISKFKQDYLSNEILFIKFLCINCCEQLSVFQILSNLYEKLSKNCVIVFDKLINFPDYENSSLKAFYNFMNIHKIKYEWIGTNGELLRKKNSDCDEFSNTNNTCVGIRILDIPISKTGIEKEEENEEKEEKEEKEEYYNFNWEKYVLYYSDLLEIKTKEEAWYHWLNFGFNEKRIFFSLSENEEKFFNWEKYIQHNNDLESIKTKEEAYNHWILHGRNEGRTYFSTLTDEEEFFDWEKYINSYKDLESHKTKEEAYQHWTTHGKKEGRNYFKLKRTISKTNIPSSDFDWIYYTQRYEDLNSITNENDAYEHWTSRGKNENRTCVFDWHTYINNSNLTEQILFTKELAFDHWIKNGKKIFELPPEFSWINYLIKNDDLQSLISNEEDAKFHWLNFGRYENRCY
jgi:hypothetical protein